MSVKFFYGADIVDRNIPFNSNAKRQLKLIETSSGKQYYQSRGSNLSANKSSSKLQNLTELHCKHRTQGGSKNSIKLKQYFISTNESGDQSRIDSSGQQITSTYKVSVKSFNRHKSEQKSLIKVGTSSKQITSKQPITQDQEQTLIQSLQLKEQNDSKLRKLLFKNKSKSPNHKITLQHKQSQSDISFDLTQKSRLNSQSTIRYDQIKDQKYRRLHETKLLNYKLALAIDLVEKVSDKHINIDTLVACSDKYISFMNIHNNLINLPSNLKGLAHAYQSFKFMHKNLKPSISASLNSFLFENGDQSRFKSLTMKSQLFSMLIYQSNLYQVIDNNLVELIYEQSPIYIETVQAIEKLYQLQEADTEMIHNLAEKVFNGNFDQVLMEAQSFYSVKLDYEFMKQWYCFCSKVQESYKQRNQHISQTKEQFDRNFDFLAAVKLIQKKDHIKNAEGTFERPRLFKSFLSSQLKKFEQRFGKLEVIKNAERESQNLADLRYDQLHQGGSSRQTTQ